MKRIVVEVHRSNHADPIAFSASSTAGSGPQPGRTGRVRSPENYSTRTRIKTVRFSCSLLLTAALSALAPPASAESKAALTIRVNPQGFEASKADIHAVCRSAGDQLLKHMDGLEKTTVVVSKGKHGPIALFDRGGKGEFHLKLDTGQTYWSQYSYQFAHEICHVLCRYEDDYKGNLWFEETLCELASLYCLREMSRTWRTDPPYANWKAFAPSLRDYTDDILRKRVDYLEILKSGLPAYYRKHAAHLVKNATDREKNGSMAVVLLALFERQPEHWNAIRWVNPAPSPEGETFAQYLTKWRDAVPEKHKQFVESIAGMYGVTLKP